MAEKGSPYRKIVRKTWRKRRFRNLSPELQRILLYFWTAPDSDNPGIFYISIPTMCDDLGQDASTMRAAVEALQADGWLMYDYAERIVFFPKWAEYDRPYNGSVVRSFMNQVLDLPVTKLSQYFLWTLKPFMDEYKILLPHNASIVPAQCPPLCQHQEQEQEQEQEHLAQAQELATHPEPDQPEQAPVSETQPNPTQPEVDVVAKDKAYKKAISDAISHWMINKMPSQQAAIGGIPGKIHDLWLPYYPTPDEMTAILNTYYYNSTSPRMVLADMTKRGDYKGEQISKVRRDAASRAERSISY